MSELPIRLFAPEVRAILAGAKTQVRRRSKVPAGASDVRYWAPPGGKAKEGWADPGLNYWTPDPSGATLSNHLDPCPYGQPGDWLWVRETFVQGWPHGGDGCPAQFDEAGNERPLTTWYRASTPGLEWCTDGENSERTPWRLSIHMPRAASRITLEVTGVRVERLQAISRGDAIAEGVEWSKCPTHQTQQSMDAQALARRAGLAAHYEAEIDYPGGYRWLWESIHGAGSWDLNPWVWVVEFKRVVA